MQVNDVRLTHLIQSLLDAVEMEIKLCLKYKNLDWCCKLSIEGDTKIENIKKTL